MELSRDCETFASVSISLYRPEYNKRDRSIHKGGAQMIFNVLGHIEMIRNGEKTQTRRVNRGVYQVGKDYAVQRKRGVKAESDIRIVMDSIWKEWCDYGGGDPYHILPKNANAEGGYSVGEFEKLFRDLNPKWDGEKRWAFKFHAVEVKKV